MTSVRTAATLLIAFFLIIPTTGVVAEEKGDDWKSLKNESKRLKIDEMADAVLDQVMNSNWKAEELFKNAYGWAAFDNLKIAFLISGGGGNGVAIKKETGERIYMKMGTGGIGLGTAARARSDLVEGLGEGADQALLVLFRHRRIADDHGLGPAMGQPGGGVLQRHCPGQPGAFGQADPGRGVLLMTAQRPFERLRRHRHLAL